MYSIGQTYKIELIKKIYYTGSIIEEDSTHIRIRTIRDEVVIINKTEILQAKLLQLATGDDVENTENDKS